MKSDQLIWILLLVAGAVGLLGRTFFIEPGMGRD